MGLLKMLWRLNWLFTLQSGLAVTGTTGQTYSTPPRVRVIIIVDQFSIAPSLIVMYSVIICDDVAPRASVYSSCHFPGVMFFHAVRFRAGCTFICPPPTPLTPPPLPGFEHTTAQCRRMHVYQCHRRLTCNFVIFVNEINAIDDNYTCIYMHLQFTLYRNQTVMCVVYD